MFDRIFEHFDARITIEYIDEFPCRRIIDRLSKTSFIGTDDRSTTCHRLDGCHTKVFIDRDVDRRCGSLDESYKCCIIWRFESYDIGLSSNSIQDIFLIRVIFPVGKDEIFFWHVDECIDDKIDSLWGRESAK